jgi:hypothetical protein
MLQLALPSYFENGDTWVNLDSIGQDESSRPKAADKVKNLSFVIRWSAIAIISAIVALSGWALSSPVGSSPDDDYHLPSIWCGQGFRDGLCEEGSEEGWVRIPYTTMANSACFAFQPDKSGNCRVLESLADQNRINNNVNSYPPLFYWTMSWLASDDIAASTVAMRFLNSILAVFAISLLVFALPRNFRRIPTLGVLISSIPLGIFILPSTNPSSWAYISILIVFSALLGFLAVTDRKRRWWLGSLFVLGIALGAGSRPDALAYSVIAIGIASWLSYSRERIKPLNILLIATSVGSLIYLHFTSGQSQAVLSGSMQLPSVDTEPSQPNLFANLAQLPELWVGVFGTWGLGWLDTSMPAVVWVITLSIFTGVIFASVRWFNFRQSIAIYGVLGALVFIPMYVLTVNGLSVGQQIQPRYLLPLIALLGAVALYRSSSTTGIELSRGQVAIIGAGLFIANTLALHLNTRRYVTGMDDQGLNLDKAIEWWWTDFPISPSTVWITASLALALLLFSLWKLREELGLPGDSNRKNR